MADEKEKYEEINLEDLPVGESLGAHGYCHLKVTRGEVVRVIKVKVVSIPQEQLIELRKSTPRPPSKPYTDPQTRQRTFVADPTDEKYIEKLEAYNNWFARELVGRGIEAKLTLANGEVAVTPEQRAKALDERGLTPSHFTDIASAILRLTDWSEEEREKWL